MTEDFNLQAFRYLLDELGAGERAAFEADLARNPAAETALQSCMEAVAQFACESAPAEPLPPEQHQQALAGILAAVTVLPAPSGPARSWKRYLWPVAAAFLLGLNLVQFFRPTESSTSRGPTSRTATTIAPAKSGQPESTISAEQSDSASRPGVAQSTGTGAKPPDGSVTEELHRLEKLRTEYATLEHEREALRAEYDAIIRQLAQRALTSKGVGRLAAMELVDATSYARGERKGLVDIARDILTEPGIVAVEPIIPPPSPNPTEPPPTNPLVPTPDGPTATENANTVNPPQPPPPTQTPPTPQPTPSTATPDQDQPYAWSVYDEAANRGYLNLYNLPTPSTDQALQLWVKSPGSTTYQSVGEVPPQFYGGAGSLYYNLPGATEPPSEILITREPRAAPPQQPTGPTILRGP